MANEIGTRGEQAVCAFLGKKQWTILEKNFRIRTAEIDIIALDTTGLKFIEVKTMLHTDIENLSILINEKKQEKIVTAAKFFLASHAHYQQMPMSFDVAVLKTNPFLPVEPEIIYIENAFGDYSGE